MCLDLNSNTVEKGLSEFFEQDVTNRDFIRSVTLSPDGKRFVVVREVPYENGDGRTIRENFLDVIDIETSKNVCTINIKPLGPVRYDNTVAW